VTAAGTTTLILDLLDGTKRIPEAIGICLLVSGGALLAYLVIDWWRGRRIARQQKETANALGWSQLRAEAWTRLRAISFQRTLTTGSTHGFKVPGQVKLPFSLEVAITSTTSMARIPYSLPEVVSELRVFLKSATSRGYRVLVGIDEVDKLESEEKAAQFLNDLKSLFGVPDCFFLVAISDDALATFERRGMPFRDVFDSTFDEVVAVEPLQFMDARRLLRRRVIGLSEPFLSLCYALSAGLARELIRAARTVIREGSRKDMEMADICCAILSNDIGSKTTAIMKAIAKVDLEPVVSSALAWCIDLDLDHMSAQRLLHHCRDLKTVIDLTQPSYNNQTAEHSALLRLLGDVAAYYYYSATILEFFGEGELTKERLERTIACSFKHTCIDRLARSRQAFAINPRVAWEQLSVYRTGLDMEAHDFPLAMSM
jgi:hypothetical protein